LAAGTAAAACIDEYRQVAALRAAPAANTMAHGLHRQQQASLQLVARIDGINDRAVHPTGENRHMSP
jgi:hypothetical protein